VEEESPVVVMAPVETAEAEAFKHESELPAWMTVGLEYWGVPVESVILSVRFSPLDHHLREEGPTNRKVTLDPAGRSGVQVKAGPWMLSPMKAIAGALTCPPGMTSTMYGGVPPETENRAG